MKWECIITAKTTGWNGRPVRMNRRVNCPGDVEGGILRAVRARRDGGAPFVGCEIVAITPLGQRVVRILEESWGEYRLDKVSKF